MRSSRGFAVGITIAAALTSAAPPSSAAVPGVGHVIVIGATGLRWDQITATGTPRLWSLSAGGATGALSIRAAGPRTCALDGWATLGAGNRAEGPPSSGPCPSVQSAVAGRSTAAAMALLHHDNDGKPAGARVGALGEAMHAAGRCVSAIGGIGAELAAADTTGRVDVTAATITPAVLARCPLSVVEADGDPSAVDAEVGRVESALPAHSTLIVVGLDDPGRSVPRLHVAVAAGPGYPRGWLVSSSTRRSPYVQLVDVAPTVLHLLGLAAPPTMIGQPLRPTAGPAAISVRRAELVDADRQAGAYRRLVPLFFSVLVIGQLIVDTIALGVLLWLRRRRRHRAGARLVRGVEIFALIGAAAPMATYVAQLVPWWRAAHPWPAVLAAVAVPAVLVGVTASAIARRRILAGVAVVAAATMAVFVGDLVTGANLQLSSLAGYSPLVAGRFAGIGNVAFGVFGTAAVLAAAAGNRLVGRRLVAAAAIGVLAVAVDGAPGWGDDFGGVLALVPGFGVLLLLLAGARISWRRAVGVLMAAVVAVVGFALLDYARPATDQTHLGRFVGQLLHGGAGTVVRRKLGADVALLSRGPVQFVVLPAAVIGLGYVLLRPTAGWRRVFDRAPELRAGLLAVLVMAVVGAVVNDSGVAIPALAMLLAVPLTIAARARGSQIPGVRDTPREDRHLSPGVLP